MHLLLSVSSSRAGGSVRPLAASDRSSDRSGFAGVGISVGSRPVGGGAFFLVISLFFSDSLPPPRVSDS